MTRSAATARVVARLVLALLGGLVPPASAPAQATADPPPTDIDVFDPIVTGTPGISGELDFSVDHIKARGGRLTTASVKLQYPVLSWLQLSLELPGSLADPDGAGREVGWGDVGLAAQARLWASRDRRAQIDVGLALGLPTGSPRVGAGSTSVQPFATAAVKLGPVDLVGDLRYLWGVSGPASDLEVFQANAAAAYPIATGTVLVSAVVPFVELNLLKPVRGTDDASAQLYVLPGLELLLPGNTTLSTGVQLPVAGPRVIDYRLLMLVKWKF